MECFPRSGVFGPAVAVVARKLGCLVALCVLTCFLPERAGAQDGEAGPFICPDDPSQYCSEAPIYRRARELKERSGGEPEDGGGYWNFSNSSPSFGKKKRNFHVG